MLKKIAQIDFFKRSTFNPTLIWNSEGLSPGLRQVDSITAMEEEARSIQSLEVESMEQEGYNEDVMVPTISRSESKGI